MQEQQVIIDHNALPMIIDGPEFKEGLPILRRIALFIMALSLLLFFVEFVVIIFGPDKIYISAEGMTIMEFLIVYPGPLIGIWLLLSLVSERAYSALQNETKKESVIFFQRNVKILNKDQTDFVGEFSVEYLGSNSWKIDHARNQIS
jgi:hypothetical protein